MNPLQMAVCLTRASGELTATVLQMAPGLVGHAQLVSVEMGPTAKISMRYIILSYDSERDVYDGSMS